MTTYIIRRFLQSIVVLILVTMIVFFSMRLLPGDPILMLITVDDLANTSEAEIEALRKEYGLDKPMALQYLDWLMGVVQGDFGRSIVNGGPVINDIVDRLPITLYLGILAFAISIIVGIPLGIISAVRRGKWVDTWVTVMANLGITVPQFWLGVLLIYLFALYLGLLPVQGYTSPFDNFWLSFRKILMPVFCLSIFPIASSARQTRSSMLEVMGQDYIRTAWSKGLRERMVIFRHALKNALIPVVTLKGMMLRNIFGGSVLIETVFNIPGMGRLAVDAVLAQDYAIVQGVTLLIVIVVLFANLLVDLSYGWLDPRIRYG
ncbi:MAG: ABC transporter permease [Deltaproteobacteria bacterium]|nr:ABC transporter permease [Deltaproteobacteria bacterium]